MITIIGTHHGDFREYGSAIEKRVRLDHFDHIFTEGFSAEGLDRFDEELDKLVKNNPDFAHNDVGGLNRGPEPEIIESATDEDTEITYLDDDLPPELIQEIAKASKKHSAEANSPPGSMEEEKGLNTDKEYDNYHNFLRDLRDDNWLQPDYAALSEKGFEQVMDQVAEDFLSNPGEYEVSFEDYVKVFGEDREEFQDQRDQEWYRKITEELEEGESALLLTGIHHAINYPGTIRQLLDQEYRTSTSPFRRFDE